MDYAQFGNVFEIRKSKGYLEISMFVCFLQFLELNQLFSVFRKQLYQELKSSDAKSHLQCYSKMSIFIRLLCVDSVISLLWQWTGSFHCL